VEAALFLRLVSPRSFAILPRGSILQSARLAVVGVNRDYCLIPECVDRIDALITRRCFQLFRDARIRSAISGVQVLVVGICGGEKRLSNLDDTTNPSVGSCFVRTERAIKEREKADI
jgi:hypothetical protein